MPTSSGQEEVAKDIIANRSVDGLKMLTDFFWTGHIVPSKPPPYPLAECVASASARWKIAFALGTSITETLDERIGTGRLNSQREKIVFSVSEMLIHEALRRTGFRCPVSGYHDNLAPNVPLPFYPTTSDAAHIIPHSFAEAQTDLEACFHREIGTHIQRE